jgi:hypothetical protein
MTHWKNITPSTREFTDSSYKRLHTPSEYLLSEDQKEEVAKAAKKKAEIRREWGMEDEKTR